VTWQGRAARDNVSAVRHALLLVAVLFALGCPREVDQPEPPPGIPCASDAECTPPGAECGFVFACVDGVCEEEASRFVPCE